MTATPNFQYYYYYEYKQIGEILSRFLIMFENIITMKKKFK